MPKWVESGKEVPLVTGEGAVQVEPGTQKIVLGDKYFIYVGQAP